MKRTCLMIAAMALCVLAKPAFSQTTPKAFTGAEATLKVYKAAYFLNDSTQKKVRSHRPSDWTQDRLEFNARQDMELGGPAAS